MKINFCQIFTLTVKAYHYVLCHVIQATKLATIQFFSHQCVLTLSDTYLVFIKKKKQLQARNESEN